MDPYLLPVIGKSEKAAADLQEGCNGYVSATPNVVVNWAGATDQLSFFIYGDADAALVIQGPDGSFLCNDDAGLNTTDPLVKIANPAPGSYKVFVGTAVKDVPALGFLAITQAEMDDVWLAELDLTSIMRRRERPRLQALPQLDPQALLTGRRPIFGSAELQAGFKPVQVFVAGCGDIVVFRMEDKKLACAGFISAVPSYSFTWTGKPQALRLFFEAQGDSVLAVVTPDGQVICGMNAAPDNLNPVVDVAALAAGEYKVYVASMTPNTVAPGRLTITGDLKANPKALAAPATAASATVAQRPLRRRAVIGGNHERLILALLIILARPGARRPRRRPPRPNPCRWWRTPSSPATPLPRSPPAIAPRGRRSTRSTPRSSGRTRTCSSRARCSTSRTAARSPQQLRGLRSRSEHVRQRDGLGNVYTVAAGDTWYSVGVRFGLPWETISAANGGGGLYPGRQLIIPGRAAAPASCTEVLPSASVTRLVPDTVAIC